MEAIATRSAGGSLFERDGVVGVVTPATPARSIPNSVTYRDASSLAAALDDLAAAYAAAGVGAWTVWTPEGDREAIALLEGAGHIFDGAPAAMTLVLGDLRATVPGDLDWDADADPAEVGRLNDLAYGFEDGSFGEALGTAPVAAPTRLYQARAGGEVACVLETIDSASDCGVYFVATHPRHRGLGLASRLMSIALDEARERGCETSTLQASPMGYPVYERLGYRAACRLHLYELRN
jgi:GNAT superfamily N-acetyltransferase